MANMERGKRGATICGLVAVMVVAWQHFGRMLGMWFRPSWVVGKLGGGMEWGFRQAGRIFAVVSAYVELLRLKELAESLYELWTAAKEVMISPIWFFASYYETVAEYAWHPVAVTIGSVGIVAVVGAIQYRYREKTRAAVIWLATKMKMHKPSPANPHQE